MFSRSLIVDSGSINDTFRVIRMISDATIWSVTNDSRVVIYNRNMFIIQAIGVMPPEVQG